MEVECTDVHIYGLNTWIPGDSRAWVPEYLGSEGPPWLGCWARAKALRHLYLHFKGHPLRHVRGSLGGPGSGSH